MSSRYPFPNQSPKDRKKVSQELKDKQESIYYREFIEVMWEFKSFNLEEFAFHLGKTSQDFHKLVEY